MEKKILNKKSVTLAKSKIEKEIIYFLKKAFKNLKLRYEVGRKPNSDEDSTKFRRNRTQIYCYVMHIDKVHKLNSTNLVFRFRARKNPKRWFQKRKPKKYIKSWTTRFSRQWSRESGTPKRCLEPAIVTDQYGLTITQSDISNPFFLDALIIYLEISAAAVAQARRRKKRDWTCYNGLTK